VIETKRIVPFLGIDFGTSKSCMASYNPRTQWAEMIRNAEGQDETPSVVYFGSDGTLVGEPAALMLEDPVEWKRVVPGVKRRLVNEPSIPLLDSVVSPPEVAAEILRKLKRDAEELHFRMPIDRAVITCPASFDVLEQDEIRNVARLAGFTEVELLEEPVAAALSYVYEARGEDPRLKVLKPGMSVLVYDLGAGTFDLAVLTYGDDGMFGRALEPRGLRQCGGDDFDRALYRHLDAAVYKEHALSLGPNGQFDLSVLRRCRERKENLSMAPQGTFSTHLTSPDGDIVLFRQTITRPTFEELVRDQIEETVRRTEELLADAHRSGYTVDRVVLIGGSARIPLVKQLLAKTLPVEPISWQKQDIAVALGAAYRAFKLWGELSVEDAYRAMVARTWGELKEACQPSLDRLANAANGLQLESGQASTVEREVIGVGRDEFLTPGRPIGAEDRYRCLVETVFATAKHAKGIQWLDQQSTKLLPSRESTARIETEVTGIRREQWLADPVVQPPPPQLTPRPESMELGTYRLRHTLHGHPGVVRSVAVSADSRYLVSASTDSIVRLWDLASGELVRSLEGHTGAVISAAFSADGKIMASGDNHRTVRLWDVISGLEVKLLSASDLQIRSLAFDLHGRIVAGHVGVDAIQLWDVAAGERFKFVETGLGGAPHLPLAFSPDGKMLAAGGSVTRRLRTQGVVKLWTANGSDLLHELTLGSRAYCLAFSPDSRWLAAGDERGAITIWGTKAGESRLTLRQREGTVRCLAISRDGTLVAAAAGIGDRETVRIWDLRTGELRHEQKMREDRTIRGFMMCVAFGPSLQLIAGGANGEVMVWSMNQRDGASNRMAV